MTQAHLPPSRTSHHQHGVALFVVIVVVLLSSLLVMWGARTSLFNELVVGNDADYQRAFAAAQSLIQDAELDIRSAEPDTNNKTADGVDCSPGGDICRMGLSDYQIPASRENEKVGILLAKLATSHSNTEGCQKGLCIKRTGKQDFWNDTATLAKMADVSEPTVNRFCRRLDTKGFPDFKLHLAQSLANGTPYVNRHVEAEDGPDTYTAKIFESTMACLDAAKNSLDISAINRCVDILTQSKKISFFGLGASSAVARITAELAR